MCDEREHLLDYLYDECDAAERRRLETHLAGCESCRNEMRGFRAVREDLLAWPVPERGSVWKPFAPPQLRPSWRDVPAWALAAAASVMLLVGAAGGFAARAILPGPGMAVALAPATTTAAQPAPAANTAMTLDQIRDLIRTEVDRQSGASGPSVGLARTTREPSNDELMQGLRQLVAASEQRQGTKLEREFLALYNDMLKFESGDKRAIDQLTEEVARLRTLIAQAPVR